MNRKQIKRRRQATPVTQLHPMGCGAACVAFVAEVSCREAVSVLGTEKAGKTGFTLREIAQALAVFGMKYEVHHADGSFREKARVPGTIVFVRRSPRYPFGHYLARSNNRWMDPWINLVTDGNLATARSDFRPRLPSSAQWLIVPDIARIHKRQSANERTFSKSRRSRDPELRRRASE